MRAPSGVVTDTSRLTHTLYLPMAMNSATPIITSATFLYDADGVRVKSVEGSVTIVYIGGAYEYQAGAVTKYYGGAAMRRSGYPDGNGLFYLLSDHLGSTSVVVSQTGVAQAFYGGVPDAIRAEVWPRLDDRLRRVIDDFTARHP